MRRVWMRTFALVMAMAWLAPAYAKAIHRIVAVGDLHGDFSAWRDIAGAAGLVDGKGRWSGGATMLVQTGDVVDRGPDSRKIIEDLMRLQVEAKYAGGRVVALVGNHEAMNMTNDLRYVSAADFEAYADAQSIEMRDHAYNAHRTAIELAYRARNPAMSRSAIRAAWIADTPLGTIEHELAWAPDGAIGKWVLGNPAVVLLDGTLFVHGGISAAYSSIAIADINRRVSGALQQQNGKSDAIINDADGPLWYRGLAQSSVDPLPAAVAAELDRVLQAYGAQRMVIGHTPLLSGIAILDGGKLVRIDTGISAVFDGVPSYLEILDGVLIPHTVKRTTAAQGVK